MVRNSANNYLTPNQSKRITNFPLFLIPVIPLAFVGPLIKALGTVGGLFIMTSWILSQTGLTVDLWSWLFWIAIIISIIGSVVLFVLYLALKNNIVKHFFDEDQDGVPEITMLYLRYSDYIQTAINFLCLYLIYYAIKIVYPEIMEIYSTLGFLVIAAFVALASALLTVGIALFRFATEIAVGNIEAISKGFAFVAAILVVLYYSNDLYPNLSKDLGGGKPVEISVYLEASQKEALRGWNQLKIKGDQVVLEDVFLIRFDADEVILVDRPFEPSKWLVIPRASVEILSSE